MKIFICVVKMFPNRDWDNHSAIRKENKKQRYCLCTSVNITLFVCRLFGLCPIRWTHIDGKCVYSVSKLWLLYSLITAGVHTFHFVYTVIHMKINLVNDRKLIIEYISIINDNISTIIIVLMILLNIFRIKHLIKMYNKCSSLSKRDLLCQSNLRINRILNIFFNVVFAILYLSQYVAIFTMNMSDSFDTNWSHTRLLMPVIQNTPILFSGLVAASCNIFSTLLTCYEKLMMLYLKFTPVHPLPGFDETSEARTVLGNKK